MDKFSYADHYQYLYQHFFKKQKLLIAVIIVMITITAVTSGLHILLIEPFFDYIDKDSDKWHLYILALIFVIISLIRSVAIYTQQRLYNQINIGIINYFHKNLIKQYIQYGMMNKDIIGKNSQDHHTEQVIIHDTIAIMDKFLNNILHFVKSIFVIIVMVGILFYQNWQLTIITLSAAPLSALTVVIVGRQLRRRTKKVRIEVTAMSTRCNEFLYALSDIMAANLQEYCQKSLAEKWQNINKQNYRIAQSMAGGRFILSMIRGIIISVLLLISGYFVHHGHMSIGSLLSFMTALIMLNNPIQKLFTINNYIQMGLASLDRIRHLENIIKASMIQQEKHQKYKKYITCQNLTYCAENKIILDDITCDINRHGIHIIQGPSGAGKSTLLQLLTGIHSPSSGSIFYDNHKLSSHEVGLERGICYAPQHPFLWDMSLRDNIILGAGYHQGTFDHSVSLSFLKDIVKKFSNGNDYIGENGHLLSGGERQRIGLARAFYHLLLHDYHILIMDEPTAALNHELVEQLYYNMEKLSQHKTIIISTHDMVSSYIDSINKIKIHDGKIYEDDISPS